MAAVDSTRQEWGGRRPLKDPPLPPRPRSNVLPVRLRMRDAETGLTVSRVVAYRFECACGDRGKAWHTWREASAERRYHAGEHEA